MTRLIDADRFIEENAEIIDCEINHPKYQETLRELIDEAPTVERSHGEWLNINSEFGGICWATCSVWNEVSSGEGHNNGLGHDYFYPNFCPNCGADMRKEGE